MSLPTIVDITVLIQSGVVTQKGFSTILVVGTDAPTAIPVGTLKEYASTAEMDDDLWVGTEVEYRMAQTIFSQTLRPQTIKVGHIADFVAQVNNLACGASPAAGSYITTINGVAYTYVSPGSETEAQIVDGMVAAITAADITKTDNGNNFDLTADNAGETFTITVSSPGDIITLTTTTASVGYQEGIATLALADNDWFGLIGTLKNDHHIKQRAIYADANQKLHGAASSAVELYDPLDSTDCGSLLKSQSRRWTHLWFHDNATEDIEAAVMGNRLAVDADSKATVWYGVTLVGITIQQLTTAQQKALEGKNVNHYGSLGGNGYTTMGKTSDGTFIDLVLAAAWFQARLTEKHQGRLSEFSNAGSRIPATNAGGALIQSDFESVMRLGFTIGHLSPGTPGDSNDPVPVLNFPTRAERTAADIAARHYKYTATVSAGGAIFSVDGDVNLLAA